MAIAISTQTTALVLQSASLTLDSKLALIAGLAEIKFSADVLAYAGTGSVAVTLSLPDAQTLTLSAGQGLSLLDAAGASVAGQTGLRALTLAGSVAQINAILRGTNGKLT